MRRDDIDLRTDGAPPHPAPDAARIERAVRELLVAVGEDPDRDGLLATPSRVARMWTELLSGYAEQPAAHLGTTFDVDHDEVVLVRDIPFSSTCEHHMLPFTGVAHVAYLPGADGRVTGLSKLARVVDGFARRLQVQERLTNQVADALTAMLQPAGVLVVLSAEHTCMSLRGVRKSGTTTVTTAARGLYKTDRPARAEVMQLIEG